MNAFATLNLNRLKWLTIILPIAFLAALQTCSVFLLEPQLGSIPGHLVASGIVAAGVLVFSSIIFTVLDNMQRKIVRQNEELSALNAVGRAVSGSLDLQEAITRALGNVMQVTQASAGEIIVERHAPDEQPIIVAQGAADELRLLDTFWECGKSGEDAACLYTDVRIVDLQRTQEPAAAEACARGYRTCACVPLTAQNSRFGLMRLLAGGDSRLGSEGSERLLAAMGSQIAVAIQASHLFRDVARRGKEAQALYEIGLEITSLQDIERILRSIVEQTREVLASETAALCLARSDGAGLMLAACSGPDEAFRRAPVYVSTSPLAFVGERPPEADAGAPCPALAEAYHACRLSAPLLVGTSVIGELCISSRAPRHFTERHRELLASLADMAAIAVSNARLLERERQMAVLEERERLSREMHDSLAQVLGYIHLAAQTTKRTLARQDVTRAEQELDDIASHAYEAYKDVREAILGLRETVSPSVGILGTLQEYLQKFSRHAGVSAELEMEEDDALQFSPDVEIQLIRVIQEALTNVRKHANADRAWIRIRRRDGEVNINIEDNGEGFDPALVRANGQRFGVRIMRERVETVGGRFEIESSPGCGTKVQIYLPLAEVRDHGAS